MSDLATGNRSYTLAISALAALALTGLVAAIALPADLQQQPNPPIQSRAPDVLDAAAEHA
jgi:hypothetical protein